MIGKRRFKSLPGGLTGGLIGGLTGGLIGGLTGGLTRGGLTGLTGLTLSAVTEKNRIQVSKKFTVPNNAYMMSNSKEKKVYKEEGLTGEGTKGREKRKQRILRSN